MKRVFLIAAVMIVTSGCAGNQAVKPQAPGFDDTATYRKKIEVRMVDCIKTDGRRKRTVSVVETTKDGVRFELEGCYGDRGEVFQIIR